ncbi:MAG: PKD domain-containing protein [Kineosporiaceae bacterium]
MIPVCPGNTVVKVGSDAGCEDAVRLCRERGQEGFMVWTYVGPPDVAHPLPGQLTPTGQRCVAEREANDPGTAPVFGEREFRRLPLPPGGLRIEPSGRPLLVTMPMNAYVEAETLTFRTRLLGVDIDVEATPTRFSWSFGDGGTLVTEDPGHPYPAMTTTHTYKALGHFRVTLATTWSGRYRISGSTEWLPVDGTATVASPPVEVEVIEARAVLVP